MTMVRTPKKAGPRARERTRRARLYQIASAGHSMIDVYDDLVPGLDRLHATQELMTCGRGEIDPDVLPGIAGLIKDIEERMRETLRLAVKGHQGQEKA